MSNRYHWNSIAERAEAEAHYMLETGCTVRACAEHFGMSKSTVHKDTERLAAIDGALYGRVRAVLGVNLQERHLRGGAATKKMYALRRCKNRGEGARPHL